MSYPDIEFVETDPEQIITSLITVYEETTGRSLKPASPERLFISWIASVIIQQRVIINETAKMNVPRYAKGEYLDSLAELFRDTERLPASPALTTVRCYISEIQGSSIFIPAGTRVSAGSNVIFETLDTVEIPAGELYGDVMAQCTTPGKTGNGYAPGQIKEIVDVYDYYQKIENLTTSGGGADAESDADYYERMRESLESYSTAGSVNSYIYWAKSVSSSISDVTAYSPTPGVVDVRILLTNGQEASETMLEKVSEALNADDVRPLTETVTVSNPDTVQYNIDLTYYIPNGSSASVRNIEAAVNAAVDEFVSWQQDKMGRDINPSYLIQLIMAAGAKRVIIREPDFKEVNETEVAKLISRTVTNGGLEGG